MNFLSLSNFDKHFVKISLILLICFLFFTSFGLYEIFAFVPNDYLQKELVKIMYIHVPAAWLALMLYVFLSVFGLLFLISQNPFYDIISKSFVKIGITMAIITLVTGSIWGKPTWGTWWVWDARLTSMLILFFIYLVYIFLRSESTFENDLRSAKVSAVFALIGLINIPIIKYSVYLWNTLHQGSSVIRIDGPTIHKSMLYPLIVMFIGLASFAFLNVVMEIKSEIYKRKIKNAR